MYGDLKYFSFKNPGHFSIGRYTYGTIYVTCWGDQGVSMRVGNFCSIGSDVRAYLGGNHCLKYVTTYPLGEKGWPDEVDFRGNFLHYGKGDIIIGSDVWIGANVIILSGVTIGNGAVIGNSTVVAKSVPPYGIVVGNPAKVIKKRFSEEEIKELLDISWWNWPDEKIKKYVPYLLSTDISDFIKRAKKSKLIKKTERK